MNPTTYLYVIPSDGLAFPVTYMDGEVVQPAATFTRDGRVEIGARVDLPGALDAWHRANAHRIDLMVHGWTCERITWDEVHGARFACRYRDDDGWQIRSWNGKGWVTKGCDTPRRLRRQTDITTTPMPFETLSETVRH